MGKAIRLIMFNLALFVTFICVSAASSSSNQQLSGTYCLANCTAHEASRTANMLAHHIHKALHAAKASAAEYNTWFSGADVRVQGNNVCGAQDCAQGQGSNNNYNQAELDSLFDFRFQGNNVCGSNCPQSQVNIYKGSAADLDEATDPTSISSLIQEELASNLTAKSCKSCNGKPQVNNYNQAELDSNFCLWGCTETETNVDERNNRGNIHNEAELDSWFTGTDVRVQGNNVCGAGSCRQGQDSTNTFNQANLDSASSLIFHHVHNAIQTLARDNKEINDNHGESTLPELQIQCQNHIEAEDKCVHHTSLVLTNQILHNIHNIRAADKRRRLNNHRNKKNVHVNVHVTV